MNELSRGDLRIYGSRGSVHVPVLPEIKIIALDTPAVKATC
jgi:hypothetical protein